MSHLRSAGAATRFAAALFIFSFPLAAQQPAPAAKSAEKPPAKPAQSVTENSADSYFNFLMGSYYEQLYEDTSRSEHATLAIEHYKKAYALDPHATVIGERLAGMYAKSQRIRDAVIEAQDVLKRDPDNVGAHRL